MPEKITRRKAMLGMATIPSVVSIGGALGSVAIAQGQTSGEGSTDSGPYDSSLLPDGIRSRFVEDINGLRMHVLEAGYDGDNRPGILLLHGFPELAYSWRKIMVPLAEAGYHVIAPDQRGYGRTTGWDREYDGDLYSFRRLNVVRDALGLVYAMGHKQVMVVGHDFGSPIAAWCAVTRPDVFTKVALMSAPFSGTGSLPFDTANAPQEKELTYDLYDELAKLPRPRKHYQAYYRTREANENMWQAPQGLHAFMRGYYHYKSADWKENKPYRLKSRAAAEMAKMPTYYIMDLQDGMAEAVAKHSPTQQEIVSNQWLPDEELQIYTDEYQRNGFQGGLNWYRSGSLGAPEMQLYAGRKIEQPSIFISGASDWGSYQNPGALERMQGDACTDMRGVHLIPGAGHWVQQEQPEKTVQLLLEFLQ
ncbi:MAG: alpha/beta hydrolase [Opitutales bacterium]|nr:alpha/beta hydrolase [Opitutales bacterium]